MKKTGNTSRLPSTSSCSFHEQGPTSGEEEMIVNACHTLNELFHQLGLPNDDQYIKKFVQTHKLADATRLHKASFWSTSQSVFISECWEDDSEWCIQIDNLDAALRA